MTPKIPIIITVLVYVLALLSGAAGVPKIMQMPQELSLLATIGLTPTLVIGFGILQTLGGLLLVFKRTRLTGAIIAGICFVVSSVALFVAGNWSFGLVSLIPVAACIAVIGKAQKR